MKTGDWYEFTLHDHPHKIYTYKVVATVGTGVVVHNPDNVDGSNAQIELFWPAIRTMKPAPTPITFKDGDLIYEEWGNREKGHQWTVRIGGKWYSLDEESVETPYTDDSVVRFLTVPDTSVNMKVGTVEELEQEGRA
jgi:hypothetical protein